MLKQAFVFAAAIAPSLAFADKGGPSLGNPALHCTLLQPQAVSATAVAAGVSVSPLFDARQGFSRVL